MVKKNIHKKGFSLIELVVVISIIALLSVLGVSTYSAVQVDARNSKRKADIKDIRDSLEVYKNENGRYPNTLGRAGCVDRAAITNDGWWCGLCSTYNTGGAFRDEDADGDSDDVTGTNGVDADDTGYIPDLAPEFMDRLPIDPRDSTGNASSGNSTCRTTAGANCYLYNSNGIDFKLLVHCTPEGTMDPEDPFFDPVRPTHAWQVSSSSTSRNW